MNQPDASNRGTPPRAAEIWSQAVPLIVAAFGDLDRRPDRDQAASAERVAGLRRARREIAAIPAEESLRLQHEEGP